MERHIMLMFSGPVDGGDDEYNKWYNEVHLPEIVRSAGFVAAQRFIVSAGESAELLPSRYLAIYEVEGSIEAAKEALAADRPSRSPVTPAFGSAVSVWLTAISDRVASKE